MRKIYDDPKERFVVYAEKHKDRIKERHRKWDEDNREKRNATSKAWRERNKEQFAQIQKASRIKHIDTEIKYKQKNKDRILEVQKKWAENNPEKRSATYKRYRKTHPEKGIESNVLRRKRINATKLIVKFTASQLRQRLSVFGGKCWICGGEADQVDHVIPLAKGGPHVLSNLRPACGLCNRKKGSKMNKTTD